MHILLKKALELALIPALSKVTVLVSGALGRIIKRFRIRRENAQIRRRNEEAKTKEEREEAARDLLNRL